MSDLSPIPKTPTPADADPSSSSVDLSNSSASAALNNSIASATTPFFADAILDLDTAHDLAETPEMSRPITTMVSSGMARRLELPSLASLDDNNGRNNISRMHHPHARRAGRRPQHQHTLRAREEQQGNSNNDPDNMVAIVEEDDDERAGAPTKSSYGRISSLETSAPAQPHASISSSHTGPVMPLSRKPLWPRDLSWAVAFVVLVPLSLIWPILVEEEEDAEGTVSPLIRPPLSLASAHALLWATAVAVVLSRFLYRTAGGPEGDDGRHVISQFVTTAAALAVAVYVALIFVILTYLPNAKAGALIPAWYTIRDVYLARRWKRRAAASGSSNRQAFFQAVCCMALDILSRSLRRASFFRVLSGVLLVQVVLLFLWRWALLGALGSGSKVLMLVAVVGGKWATGTVARLLSLLASGGVVNWTVEQSIAVANLDRSTAAQSSSSNGQTAEPGDEEGDDNGTMPDAYRSVDASVYESVLSMEDALDDDYEDEDEFLESPSRAGASQRATQLRSGGAFSSNGPNQRVNKPTSTVKSLLSAGLTVSFGSVAQCGLLGGPAQFVWSQLRKVDTARSDWAQARRTGDGTGFAAMQVGSAETGVLQKVWENVSLLLRGFVRSHSDLAMSHVAAYYKSYAKAARDVAVLVEDSGVEPILHEDISTHMCACVGGMASGLIVLGTGFILIQQRDNDPKHVARVSDVQVLENMILAFILCYTLIFTVMEPLRAAIKSVYVSFAQHPRSLSQAYPLIFRRLSRLSASNIS